MVYNVTNVYHTKGARKMIERNNSIQGWRGIFAIGVMLSHCFFAEGYFLSEYLLSLSNVSFFFVLSGYLLYATYKPEVKFGAFLGKKMSKLYPLHLILLLCMVFFKLIRNTFALTFSNIISLLLNLTLLHTVTPDMDIVLGFNSVSWFLSCLVICFAICYWLMKLINKPDCKIGAVLLYSIAAVLLVAKVVLAIIFPENNELVKYFVYFCPLASLGDFCLGMTLYRLTHKIELSQLVSTILQIASLALIIAMFATKIYIPTNCSAAFYTLPFSLLLVFAYMRETKFSKAVFGNKVAVFVGSVSFELYLIHDLLITCLANYTGIIDKLLTVVPLGIILVLLVILTIFVSWLYKWLYTKLINLIKSKKNKEVS